MTWTSSSSLLNGCRACGSFANKQNWNWLYQAFVVVLIVFQLLSFLAYFYGTLQVRLNPNLPAPVL